MTLDTRKPLKYIHDDVEYYPHQLEGIRLMARMNSFLLADEMGLGKTLQALTVAAVDFQRDWADRVLVIAPASIKWNWGDECDKFTSFTYTVLDGPRSKREQQLEAFDADILIVNYEQVTSHLDELNAMSFDIAIFDEAHYIKNPKSKRTKACLKLRTKRSFMLTGSPLLNRVNELWSILHRIAPADFPNYWRFVNRYCLFGGYKNKEIIGVKNRAELMMAVEQVMIRRLKEDVLDLPDKIYCAVSVALHPEQRKLYDEAMEELRITLPDEPKPMELENALTKFLRLKQICGTTLPFTGFDHSSKLDRVTEMVDEITYDHPVVVFTQFRDVLKACTDRVDAMGVPTYVLHGDVPPAERLDVVRMWGEQSGPPYPALIAMLQVAGVGLNLTAASSCIFIDKLFVPKMNEQAEDRLHRIGTKYPVTIYQMICHGTIEHRIEAILRRKRKLFDEIVDQAEWRKMLYRALIEEEES